MEVTHKQESTNSTIEDLRSADDTQPVMSKQESTNSTDEDRTSADGTQTLLSKNQLKKLKKREKWMAIKQDKRRNAKLKRKHRLAERRENGEDTGPTRKSLKRKVMSDSNCKIKIAIDLAFDEYMAEKEINSLTCQLQHSYAANRRAENSLQLYFCGIGGKTKERLDRIGDYKGWDIYPEARQYDQVFPKESLVYLSSESDNILTTLSDDKVYVIGGLVDHNKHKGLCHRLAEEKGIAHAQLPISDFLDMKTRKVLTVNQVFTILLRYTETKDWKKAFLSEMPQRKQAYAKDDPSPQEKREEENESEVCSDQTAEKDDTNTDTLDKSEEVPSPDSSSPIKEKHIFEKSEESEIAEGNHAEQYDQSLDKNTLPNTSTAEEIASDGAR